MVEIWLAKAILCVAGQCFPMLAGANTPVGTHPLEYAILDNDRGRYDVLMFKAGKKGYVYAIHRSSEERLRLIEAGNTGPVTAGCINVTEPVFDMLVECCSNSVLEIRQ